MRLFLTSVAVASLMAVSAVAAAPSEASGPPETFDRSAWQEDFAQLKQSLQDNYANLAWVGSTSSGVDLPTLDQATVQALSRAKNDAEASSAIRSFVNGFRDGHFSELAYLAVNPDAAAEPDQPVLDPTKPQAGCAALGFSSNSQVGFSLPLEMLPDFELVGDGLASTFRTGIVRRDGRALGIVRIQAFRARGFPMTCLHAWSQLRESGTPITADALLKIRNAVWVGDLADAIAKLREQGADALVIDVGRNDGGDDSGDWLARLFTTEPVRSARLMMVDAPITARYFGDEGEDLDEALGKASSVEAKSALSQASAYFAGQKDLIGKGQCDMSWVWQEQRTWSPTACNHLLPAGYAAGFSPGLAKGAYSDRAVASALSSASRLDQWFGVWSGPTYVLTDRRSYSSAEMFAAVMQDNHIAKVVGARTGGDGCGFMLTGDPVVLQHSRLRFRMPNCMRLRADGSNEKAGISPDIAVLPAEGESDRARASRAVSVMIADAFEAKTEQSISR